MCARLLRLLLECVKDVDRFSSRREVAHSVRSGDVNSDLTNARSDSWHPLPVVRFKSLLNAPQLDQSAAEPHSGTPEGYAASCRARLAVCPASVTRVSIQVFVWSVSQEEPRVVVLRPPECLHATFSRRPREQPIVPAAGTLARRPHLPRRPTRPLAVCPRLSHAIYSARPLVQPSESLSSAGGFP